MTSFWGGIVLFGLLLVLACTCYLVERWWSERCTRLTRQKNDWRFFDPGKWC